MTDATATNMTNADDINIRVRHEAGFHWVEAQWGPFSAVADYSPPLFSAKEAEKVARMRLKERMDAWAGES